MNDEKKEINLKSTKAYKLIYVFQTNDDKHKGFLKVGEATLHTEKKIEELTPSCHNLNQAALARIRKYTQTAGMSVDLLYTRLAIYRDKNKGNKLTSFSDHDIHSVLLNSGIEREFFDNENRAKEWFKTDLQTIKNAIDAFIIGRKSLTGKETSFNRTPIMFRPEQKEAINRTIKKFKSKSNPKDKVKMLWNAKMRFGKTLCALQVVKEMNFDKTIIICHRPVVNSGWHDDFKKIFYDRNDFEYDTKQSTGGSIKSILKTGTHLIYFASIQDLRGSQEVGGKFDKNNEIFSLDWDCVIIDEAHEGTQTALGKSVTDELLKNCNKTPCLLALSGTPFNIADNYDEKSTYIWDYVMEQKAKEDWYLNHESGDSNPYEDLPKMNIYTYELSKVFKDYKEDGEIAFNFKEFFRTWTGVVEKDLKKMPVGAKVGDFVHQEDVEKFLDMLVDETQSSNYPFSTNIYRDNFRHSLWVLPGVSEAKAMSELLKNHRVFQHFEIANVAGEGDYGDITGAEDALDNVRKAIGDFPEENYSITLSCGRLTTGVTVPEWTAALLLYGTYTSSPSSYLQTIFRVQSPGEIGGQVKEECCVFDFAPDRALTMIADASNISIRPGDVNSDESALKAFLKYCPVLSVSGSTMEEYDTNRLMQEVKKVYAERIYRNGFDDIKIYSKNLDNLTDEEVELFKDLEKIIGKTKQAKKVKSIVINDQGLTAEEEALEKKKKKKKELTEKEKELLEKKKIARERKSSAVSILRGISIRIPLLIYGANVDIDKDITIDNFESIIDDESWKEFMPNGVTKEKFNDYKKFYDKDLFIATGREIRNRAKAADALPPLDRVDAIAEIFSTFKNPDKETVLTPWRVVNMHMSQTLGGYNFYKDFDVDNPQLEDEPKFIDQGEVTSKTLANVDSKILEINSKSGLYPLYCAYSIFKKRCKNINPDDLTLEKQNQLWKETVEKNIYVICKTEMARQITKRTLIGYCQDKTNTHVFDDLIMQVKDKQDRVIERISSTGFWNIGGIEIMKFDAIVGNPPYQLSDGGAGASAIPIYNYFVSLGKKLNPTYLSLIMPSRWMTAGKGLDQFRDEMIHDRHISLLHDYVDSKECFNNVDIKGGVCYFIWDRNYKGECNCFTHDENGVRISKRNLSEEGDNIFIREERLLSIKEKVCNKDFKSLMLNTSPRRPYGLNGDVFSDNKKYNLPPFSDTEISDGYKVIGLDKSMKRKWKYIPKDYPFLHNKYLDKYKAFVPRSLGSGELGEVLSLPVIAQPGDICTETFIQVGPYDTELEVQNFVKYYKSKFFRTLMGIQKQTQAASQIVYKYVPCQDFTSNSDINWNTTINEIDKQLYAKYNLDDGDISFIESKIQPMK